MAAAEPAINANLLSSVKLLAAFVFFFRSASASSPIRYCFICSLASLLWPTSSNSVVASFPAYSISTSSPPGCSWRNLVTSYTLSWMTIHTSVGLLCWPTSASVYCFCAISLPCIS
uniref:Putative secreted protein n=1 Tax=Anopheles triannulatus TaxID=58253 RepID=A0A2M4B198_9DIPT